MKKFLLSLAIVFAAIHVTTAQIAFSHEGSVLGDTVTIWIDPNLVPFHEYKIAVHNQSANGMNIKIAREIINELTENQISFCWGSLCFPPTVDTSSNYQFVASNGQTGENEALSADYSPLDQIGTSIVKYTAYNMDSPDVKKSVVIKYWVSPTGVEEDIMKGGHLSEIYPNPASNFITLDYQLTSGVRSAQVTISNLLGSIVAETELPLNASQLKLNVDDLENGIYFYSILLNGEIYTTKKLIVRN